MMPLKRGKRKAKRDQKYKIEFIEEDRGNKCPRGNKRRYNKDIVSVE